MSHDETEPMYGWLICRFDRKQIHSILYGQFSRQAMPPTSGWVFLAKNASEPTKETDIMKLPREGLDGQNLALFAKGIDPDDLASCLGTSTEGEGIVVNAAFLQNDRDPSAPATRYYVLRNCGIPAVNGRYMEGGFHEDAPLYRNVREWAIVRTKLKEIPELGINAKGSYAIQEGASISELYHEAAAEAYSDLLAPGSSDGIRDGSYHFKKRFMALSRAGNRMVTGDQSLQLDFINRKRAALRSDISANLLLSLQDVHIDSAAHELASSESKDPQQTVQLPTIMETERTRRTNEDSATEKGLAKTTSAGELFSRSQVASYMNETLESCAPDTIKTGFSTAPNSPSSAILDPAGSSSGDEGELGEEGLGGRVSASAPPDRVSKQASTAAQRPALEATEVAVETDITLGRSISYQRASQGYVLNRLSQDDPSSSSSNNKNNSSVYSAVEVPEEDLAYVDAEAELAREVTLCIEEREAALTALRWEASRLRRAYVDGTESAAFSQFNQWIYSAGDAPRSPFSTAPPSQFNSVALYSAAGTGAPPAEFYQSRIEDLLERMREVRRLSLAFADAFAAWVRLLHKQKAARWRREKKKAEQFGASYHRMNRNYAVVLAQRSAKELYAQSQAVKSTVKKFSRGMEPVKYATDISLVGIFDTREEAEAAFEQAFNAIPQEYMLLPELQAVNKKLTGLRRCGQHYWVHSSSVPQDLECEQCRLQKQQHQKAASGVPELYKEEPVSQFIWQGHNYLEKMWTDTSFLAEVEYLRRALPEEDFAANPLLLSNASVQELLYTMHEHKYGSKTLQTHNSKQRATSSSGAAPLTTGISTTAQSSRHPLNALRGKKELLRNAAKAGDAYNAHIKQRDYDAKYIDNPYNNTATFGRIGRQKTSSEHTDNRSYGSVDSSPLQQPGSQAPSMASSPGFYATSSSARHAGSVFNESASSAADGEYGQPVTENGSDAPSQAPSVQSQRQQLRLGLDSSLQTTAGSSRTAMRASQSAPYFSSTSDQATAGMGARSTNRPAELKSRTIAAYTSKSAAAGSGAVGARSAARNRSTAAGDGSVLTTEAGLDLNRHLPAELRTGRALPPLSQSTVGGTGTLQSRRTIWGDRRWDRDFLGDDAEQRERLSRALQVIGQCPVPENAIQSDPAAMSGGVTGTFGTTGPEEWARTVPGSPNRTATSMPSTARNITLSTSPITALIGAQTQQDGRSQALPKQSLVEAFYSYRGAQMSLLQERVPVAYRTEEIFCRTDVGEFAGLTKGRALRAFDFQQQLYKTGKEKEQHRKHMQQLLRAAVAVDIIHCDVPYIQRLVQHATAMNASMLELDIAQAAVFLRHFAVTCKYALRGQAWYRGDRDRKRVAEIRRKIKAQKRHRRTTEIESAALALTWVPSLLKECVQQCVRRERRSVFRFTMNMSGVLCMVSLRRQASPSRKPLSPTQLCAGCNTATIITKFEPADRSYSTHRTPCTCVFLSPQEQWQLNIYNPLLRENFPHLLSVAQVRQMLRGIERAALVMRSQDYAQRALIGASFGDLQPLFLYGSQEGDDDAFNGRRLDRSFSNAMMRAALESAVLPRLPLRLPDQLSHIIATPGQHQYVASDYVRTTSTTTGKMIGTYLHSVMTDCSRPGPATEESTGELHWNWHPLVDAVRVRNEISRSKMLSEQLRYLAEQAALLVQCRRSDKEALCVDAETASIEFEDARSAVLRVSERILIAAERITEVMKFSRRLEADMHAEEQGQQLDDRQSYEAVESANIWIGLNEKRKLEAQHEVMFADCKQKAEKCGTVYQLYESACVALLRAEEHHAQCVLQYEQHFPFIAQKQRELQEMRVYTRAAADAVLRTYSMPRRIPPYPVPRKHTAQEGMQGVGRYTSARRLQRVPWNLVFVRDPLERLRLANRGALAVLQKRVMKLRPMQRTLDGRLKPYLRCVVLVLLDELTGYMVVHVGQEAASVEEANQHTDLQLQKSDFSDLTSHGLDGDIILRPEDVDWVLSVPVEFSAYNLRRAEKCAKGGGQFQLDPNKLPVGASARDLAVVLPSQALRPVLAIRRSPAVGEKLRRLKPSYQQRRDELEQAQVRRAEQLLQYLRLQAHTGRPCVGLVHFRRRLAYSHKQLAECSWLSDLVNCDPLMLVNPLRSSQVLLNDGIATVHMYSTLRRFNVDLQLPYSAHPTTLHTEIPVDSVLTCLRDQPLLLGAFLWQLVTNSVSPQLLSRIFRQIDWELPGQLDRSYWRRPFADEIAHPHFLVQEAQRYRGPVYQRHRFVSSSYFLAELYTSAQHDIRIALKRPVDGKFAEHQYRGPVMFVHISRAELCALVGKAAVRAELVPGSMLGTLLLLHPHNLHMLFALLLELVHLSVPLEQEPHSVHPHHSHHHHTQQHNPGETHHHHHHHRGVSVEPPSLGNLVSGRFVLEPLTDSTALQFDVAVSLPQLRDRLCLMLEKFNHWVTGRHAQEMSTLGADFTDSVQLQLARLSVPPQEAVADPQKIDVLTALYNRDIGEVPFTVRMERDPSNKQQMRVYHSVWAFTDLDKFYGDATQQARRDIEAAMLQARSGVSCRLLRSLREFNVTGAGNNARKAKFPTFTPAAVGCDSLESLMGVEVMTNVSKTRLLIEISPVDLGHHDAKQIVSAHEQAMLQEEDQLSDQLRTSSAVLAARLAVDRRLRQLEQTLHTKLLPQQETLERRNHQVLTTARSLQKHFTSTYEHSKARHAQRLAILALSLLTSAGAIHRPSSAVSSMMRATVTPVRLPVHLSSNAALVKLAAWVNDTLRHHRRSLPSISTTNLRFICDSLQGTHNSIVSTRDVAGKYNCPPAFTTETLPRSEKVSDTSGPSALEQLGGGFRDPDRWYHARRVRPRPIIPKKPPCETDPFPIDCSAALRSRKLLSATTLAAVLSPTYDAAEPLTDVRSDPQYVVREVLDQGDASVTFQLLDLLSSATVSLRAVCSTNEPRSPQLPPQSALLRTLASLVAAVEEQIHTGNAARIEEINATTAEIEQCHSHFRALTAALRVSWKDAQPVLAAASAIIPPSCSSVYGVSVPAEADVGHALQPSTPVALTHKSRKHERRSRKHRTESDDYSVKSAELPAGFIGFLVPQDESLPYQELYASTVADWQQMVGRHLQALPSASAAEPDEEVSEVRLLRYLSPFAIMYFKEEPETRSSEDHHHAHRHRHHQHRHHKAQAKQEETVNTRAMALLAQFSDAVLSGAPSTAVASRGHRQPAPPALCSDVVLLLRHGHRHFTALEAALRAMVEAYAPMRALRLQKEGREKLWRLSNHQHFRLLVCGLSYTCMRAVERMYSILKPAIPASANPFPAPVARVNELPVYQTRLILTRFDDLRSRHAGHSAGSGEDWWRALGCLGLLDYAVVAQRDTVLAHFDEQCPAGIDFGDFNRHNPHLHSILSDAQSATDNSSSDEGLFYLSAPSTDSSAVRTPIFTAGQVVYAMYQLHCYNCQLPAHCCRFPGCGAIRSRALAEMGALEPVLEHSQGAAYLGDLCLPSPTEASDPNLQRVRGSGLHPIDVAVKEHLFQSTSRLFTLMPPLRVSDAAGELGPTDTVDSAEQHDISVEEEVRREQSWDLAVVVKHERDVRLQLQWRELQKEAAMCHALHNAMIRPELAQCFSARELLLAKGGVHAQEEIAAIRKLVTHALVTQSAAAHSDYTAYSSTADSQLMRLVPSAAMLEQQHMLEQEGGMQGEGVEHEEESVTGSKEAHSESSSSTGSGSSSSSEYSDSEQSAEFTETSEGTSVVSAEGLDLAVTVRKTQTHSIPISLLRALSTATLDPSDSSLSEFDPYPSDLHSHHHHHHHHHRRATNAMPHAMYTLLMQRLRLTRRDRLPVLPPAPQLRSSVIVTGTQSRKGSAFAIKIAEMAASQAEDHCFRFDRLYCEQAAVLQDGSNVLVQCLHGVLEGASLVVLQRPPVRGRPRLFLSDDVFPNIEVHDTASGAPPAAVRFLETDRLSRLRLGMTVVVFDILSTVSRAFIIEQRSLKRTCEAFGVGPEDYGGLARSICSRAHRCVYLARAGLYCTSVMFSVASLHEQTTAAGVVVPTEVEQTSTEQSPSLEDNRSAAVETRPVMVSDRYLARPDAALLRFSALSSFLAEA